MKTKDLADRLARRAITRRELGAALASVGLGLAALPVRGRRAMAAANVEYFTWASYEDPAFHQPFIEKHGASPVVSHFGEEEEALQKLRSGYAPDLAHPCTYSVGRWQDAGVLKPIDVSRLQHYGDIWPELTTIEGTTFDGQPYFVPWDWGNASILYRTDLVDVEEDSWTLLFDERYAGRLATYDSADGAIPSAALALGYRNVNALTEEQLAEVEKLLIKQRPLLRYYWVDNSTLEQSLATGEVVASYAWNSSVVTLKQQGLPVEYMNPKEGILTWVCGLVLIKDARGDEQAAYDFIDAMLDPESGRALIDNFGYGHSNRKSFELVGKERLAELGISSPADLFAQGVFLSEVEPSLKQRYTQIYEAVKAGVQ